MKHMNAVKRYAAPVVAVGLTVAGSAHAALPQPVIDAFSALSGNVTDIQAAVWPILAATVGGFALMKLFRKGANKAV